MSAKAKPDLKNVRKEDINSTCSNCGKHLGFYDYALGKCTKCNTLMPIEPQEIEKETMTNKKSEESEEKKQELHTAKKTQERETAQKRSSTQVKEIKCKCNQCKHVWHYLEEDEKDLERQVRNNALIGCGMCCNPLGGLYSNKAIDLSREAKKLQKCPKCGSGDITKKEIYYEKKA